MSRQTFPVLCWKLGDGLVCGDLISGDLQIVRQDTRKVLTAMASAFKGEHAPAPQALTDFHHKRFIIPLRPSWRTDEGSFPAPETIDVPVDAVYGTNDMGSNTCHLPRLGDTFYFYEPERMDTLVLHYARDTMSRKTPEWLTRYLLAPKPWLETLSVRAKRPAPRRRKKPAPDTPRLDQVTDRFPLPARQRPRGPQAAWQRATEVNDVARRLLRPASSVLVVGEPGVGKTAILGEALRRVVKTRDAPSFWRSGAQRLVSGARYLGDWQELADQIVEELKSVSGVLWVTDLAQLLRVGGSGTEDSLAAFWTPLLLRGELRIVSEITPRALDAARGLMPEFISRFQIVRVDELSRGAVKEIVGRYREYASTQHDVLIEPRAGLLAHRLLERHLRYERFPGKAVRFLSDLTHRALQDAEVLGDVAPSPVVVDEASVMAAFVERTGMPESLLNDAVPLSASELRAYFSERVIGQTRAVDEAARVVEVFKAGLNDPDKPVATMLFAGPTGVGKTALVKAMADWFFGQGQVTDPLVRVDMSEFQHPGQLDRLIGDPRGEPGSLVKAIRERPFSVLLLDEIEKASPVFFDTLLSVLDEGRLVDALGRETDFRGAVVVMTTNLGASSQSVSGFAAGSKNSEDPSKARSDTAIRAFFRPEFFNRIDRVVHFSPLDEATVRGVARKELGELSQREGMAARGVTLTFTDALVALVMREGFDPAYGARALQRVVERRVVAALARFLLSSPGGGALTVDAQGDEVVVKRRG